MAFDRAAREKLDQFCNSLSEPSTPTPKAKKPSAKKFDSSILLRLLNQMAPFVYKDQSLFLYEEGSSSPIKKLDWYSSLNFTESDSSSVSDISFQLCYQKNFKKSKVQYGDNSGPYSAEESLNCMYHLLSQIFVLNKLGMEFSKKNENDILELKIVNPKAFLYKIEKNVSPDFFNSKMIEEKKQPPAPRQCIIL